MARPRICTTTFAACTPPLLTRMTHAHTWQAENGVDIYLHVLDSFPDDDRIARIGGKFLSRITGDSIEELIAILREKGVSAAQMERTLALLASLAIEGKSMEDIVHNGGVQALVDALELGLSGKALENTCKAIARIAANARNIQALVDAGAIGALVTSLGSSGATSDSKAQAIEALCRIAANSQYTEAVVAAGSIPAVVAALASDPSNAGLAAACLKFFTTLQKNNFDMDTVAATDGSIAAVVSAMAANPSSQVSSHTSLPPPCSH